MTIDPPTRVFVSPMEQTLLHRIASSKKAMLEAQSKVNYHSRQITKHNDLFVVFKNRMLAAELDLHEVKTGKSLKKLWRVQ